MNGLLGNSERDQEEARRQAMLMLGLGLLGIPKGQEALGIQRAGLLGMDAGDRYLENRRRGRLADVQTATMVQGLQEKQRAFADADEERRLLQEFYASGGAARGGGGVAPSTAAMFGAPGGPNAPLGPVGGAAPAAGAMQSPRLARFNAQMALAERYKQAGRGDVAQRIEDQALKVLPKVKEVKEGQQNGRRVSVVTFEDGTQELSPYGPAMEKLELRDTGDRAGVGFDPFTGAERSPGVKREMSAAERDAAARGWAGLRVQEASEARQAAQVGQPTFHEGQYVYPPVAAGPGGAARPARAEAVAGYVAPDKTPATLRQQLAQNEVTLAGIDRALALIEARPESFGAANYLPDALRQRTDPEGVEGRAIVANLAGQKIHDRSGAAVTVGEMARLRPYIPNVTDLPDTISKKLRLFKREYEQLQRELSGGKLLHEIVGGRVATGKVVDFNDLPGK